MSIFSTAEDMRDERAFAHLVNHKLHKTAPAESKSRKNKYRKHCALTARPTAILRWEVSNVAVNGGISCRHEHLT